MAAGELTVYRGQKSWAPGMDITASALRKNYGRGNPREWTEFLLTMILDLIDGAERGDVDSRNQLENQLLFSQQAAYQNPFVSCSRSRAVALGFALHGDTPGYVLTVVGDHSVGVDFQALRQRFGLFGDAVDHLEEYGLPRRLEQPFIVTCVDRVDPVGSFAKVFP